MLDRGGRTRNLLTTPNFDISCNVIIGVPRKLPVHLVVTRCKDKFVPVPQLNILGSGGIAPRIPDLGTSWR